MNKENFGVINTLAQKSANKLNGSTASLRKSSSIVLQEEITQKSSRSITAAVKHAVKQRDGCQCTFVSKDKRRCAETKNLHFDHKDPFALGGCSTVDNLRLLCPAHNRLEATKVFGAARIASIVQVAKNEAHSRLGEV